MTIAGVGKIAVAIFMPERYSNDVSLEILEYDARPPLLPGDDIDTCVEFDLDLPSGKLGLEEPANEPVLVGEVAAGRYRLRWLGLGFDGLPAWRAAADLNEGETQLSNPDHERLELWPVTTAALPVEHRRHPELDRR